MPHTNASVQSSLPHSNISIRIPRVHAELIVKAAVEADEDLSRWVASRAVEAAASELGVEVPVVPAPLPRLPARDRIRAAARAAGLSEDAFKAAALEAAIRAHLKPGSVSPPAMDPRTSLVNALESASAKVADTVPPAKKRSGEYTIDLSKHTPAEAARLARAGG